MSRTGEGRSGDEHLDLLRASIALTLRGSMTLQKCAYRCLVLRKKRERPRICPLERKRIHELYPQNATCLIGR